MLKLQMAWLAQIFCDRKEIIPAHSYKQGVRFVYSVPYLEHPTASSVEK